jgi:chromatin remodeling complex protein RSC6
MEAPFTSDEVEYQIESKTAELINLLKELKTREAAIAITYYETAAMWAVKAVTSEQPADEEARRANSAFLRLRPISDELATFMGLPASSQSSWTDVTKFIANYVRTHNCVTPDSGISIIIPDDTLRKLLRVRDGQEVNFLNLHSFLKCHFPK